MIQDRGQQVNPGLAVGDSSGNEPEAVSYSGSFSPGPSAQGLHVQSQRNGAEPALRTGSIVAAIPSFASAFVTVTVMLQTGIAGYVFLLGRMEPIQEPE
jgi:hypothetical protein